MKYYNVLKSLQAATNLAGAASAGAGLQPRTKSLSCGRLSIGQRRLTTAAQDAILPYKHEGTAT
jgi:hypothetical protein